MPADRCPLCNADLDNGDVFAVLRRSQYYHKKSDAEVVAVANQYGWTPRTRRRFSRRIGIEENDRIARWRCPDCKGEW